MRWLAVAQLLIGANSWTRQQRKHELHLQVYLSPTQLFGETDRQF